MPRLAACIWLLAALAAPGCGSDRATRGEGTVEVIASPAPVVDIVRNAGGRRVEVTAVADGGMEADLLVYGGGSLDPPPIAIDVDRALVLLPRVDPIGADPYWWHDPVRVERAAKEIRNELARADVDGAGYYEAATADFLARLRRLDAGIRDCLDVVPRPWPVLPGRGAGLRYFAARYGIELDPKRGGLGVPADAFGGSYLETMPAKVTKIVDALSRGSVVCRPRP